MKRLTLACMLGLLGANLVSGSSTGAAAALPANGRILFTHCEDTCQIYTANPDGSAVRTVTHGGDSFQGDWSPDGTRIAYVSYQSGDAAIWIVDADGTHRRQLTPDDPDSDNFWPRFTSNGRWILFTNCFGFDCDGGISAVRPDGTGMHAITPNSHESYNMADDSPDGSRITYMRWHAGGVKNAIYVARADGSHERRVSPPALEGWNPDWSPTGARILFTSYAFFDRPAPSLYTVRPDGSGLTAITHPPFPHADYRGSYSPDGSKVLFESDRRYGDFCCSDLFIVGAAGGAHQRVHLPFDAYEPRWGTAPLLPASSATARASFGIGGPTCAHVKALARLTGCPMP